MTIRITCKETDMFRQDLFVKVNGKRFGIRCQPPKFEYTTRPVGFVPRFELN